MTRYLRRSVGSMLLLNLIVLSGCFKSNQAPTATQRVAVSNPTSPDSVSDLQRIHRLATVLGEIFADTPGAAAQLTQACGVNKEESRVLLRVVHARYDEEVKRAREALSLPRSREAFFRFAQSCELECDCGAVVDVLRDLPPATLRAYEFESMLNQAENIAMNEAPNRTLPCARRAVNLCDSLLPDLRKDAKAYTSANP